MSSEAPDIEKQNRIAEAAFTVFATNGFRRTSMEKIAAEAGMSRPALYMHFGSKEDVFAHLTIGFFQKVADRIDAVLRALVPAETVLRDVLDAWDPDGVMAILLDAEHGSELMEVKSGAASAEIADIETRILASLATWLSVEADAGRIDCADPELTAQTILSSYYGLKTPPPDYATYKARVANLAQMLGKGLHLPK